MGFVDDPTYYSTELGTAGTLMILAGIGGAASAALGALTLRQIARTAQEAAAV
jgi:hypothetical protein